MLPIQGLTQQFFRGFGIDLPLFYLFFFGDLVASVGKVTLLPCTVVSDQTIDEDFLISF